MKQGLIMLALLVAFLSGMAQPDSLLYPDAPDSLAKKEKVKRNWIPFSVGVAFTDGGANYFEGYNYLNLRSNIQIGRIGFPIHNDWSFYTPFATQPEYFEAGGFFHLADTNLNLRLRMNVSYSQIRDTMFYQSGFAVDDTVFRRSGSESIRFLSLGITMMKTSRNFGKTVRFYAGGMGEVFATTGSQIEYTEAAYDLGLEEEVSQDVLLFNGKPRLNLYASAVVGIELTFFQRIGLVGEVHSGIGTQVKVNEKPTGISKVLYSVGVQYFLVPNKGNVRKKEPIPLPPKEERFQKPPPKKEKKEKGEE